jgi:hypothetical protein
MSWSKKTRYNGSSKHTGSKAVIAASQATLDHLEGVDVPNRVEETEDMPSY